ncbi:MAG: DUF2269 domain-containing protein [Rhodobacteraceae bacterium]|jgi:uncharacterized membrane protein|nr:DUF2269 domain-containing protein [Paracoccaceae bacterium]MBL4558570.1 DUF2269 domain-containing protein [Paracoccaceae bacterium]HBH00229.1 DUF2269 domain-containing protein [Paracoccaceae bacterium]
MDAYLLLKWLHILSATVLFGTGIGTAFQMVMAMRNGDPAVIHGVARAVVAADWIFTTPAGVIQPATGLALVWLSGTSLTADWLLLTYAAYLLAFACWAPVVLLQMRIRDLAAAAMQAGVPLPARARQLYRIWFALGWPAFLALAGVFWLMVTKPDFG